MKTYRKWNYQIDFHEQSGLRGTIAGGGGGGGGWALLGCT